MIDYDFCISSYLTFRYIAKKNVAWKKDVYPLHPTTKEIIKTKVKNSTDVLEKLPEKISNLGKTTGILLSAGIDSGILAAFLSPGTKAYTIRFISDDSVDESTDAAIIASKQKLDHTIIDVSWEDYDSYIDLLMKNKKSPLHPVEVGLYKAAITARRDGINQLIVGTNADSIFGGLDKLLAKDWTFDEFVKRYTFLDPKLVIKQPVSVIEIFEPFKTENGFNVYDFIKKIYGIGNAQMFENAIHSGGCKLIAPYENFVLDFPLDITRIRNGEPKYILNDVYRQLYPYLDPPKKIPFARPVSQWLKNWSGPKRPEFLENLMLESLSGEQKWQLYCLERFLNLLEIDLI